MQRVRTIKSQKLGTDQPEKVQDTFRNEHQGICQTRTQKIRQKNIIYPLSTSNKIVFITNQYGVGFKREKLQDYGCPSHVPAQAMLHDINQACYKQWKTHHQKLQTKPFQKLELILGGIQFVLYLTTIIYLTIISQDKNEAFEPINIIYLTVIALIMGVSFFVCASRREKDSNLDVKLIRAIKQKLIDYNNAQRQKFGIQIRYRWTCHRDCLWIALNL